MDPFYRPFIRYSTLLPFTLLAPPRGHHDAALLRLLFGLIKTDSAGLRWPAGMAQVRHAREHMPDIFSPFSLCLFFHLSTHYFIDISIDDVFNR
jgi:hypothetical protein